MSQITEAKNGSKTAIASVQTTTTLARGEAETATALMAAKAEAEVKARYAIAIARPRDEDAFRQRILRACTRPRFAEAAVYEVPVSKGKTVKGLSVRFAEQALQYYGNLYQSTHTLVDDMEKRIVHCSVIDLETNSGVGQDIVIEKYVERQEPRRGDEVISSRENSYGQTVYRIRATEDALLTKSNNLQAKLRRGLILQLIPADLKEEALETALETARDADAADPDAARRKLLDAFFRVGVDARAVKEFVGVPMEQLQSAHLEQLRGMFMAIQSGDATWAEFVTAKAVDSEDKAVDKPATEKKKK